MELNFYNKHSDQFSDLKDNTEIYIEFVNKKYNI